MVTLRKPATWDCFATQNAVALQRGIPGIALSADIDFGVRRLAAKQPPATEVNEYYKLHEGVHWT